jgi:acyl-CoA thioesterase FadM
VVGLAANAIAAEGSAVLVLYDYNKAEPCPIPDRIRKAIDELQPGGAAE